MKAKKEQKKFYTSSIVKGSKSTLKGIDMRSYKDIINLAKIMCKVKIERRDITMTKKLDDIAAEVNKIIADRDAEVTQLETDLETEGRQIEEAEKAVSVAIDHGTLEEYQSAKSQLKNAQDLHDMHEARLSRLTDDPLISNDQFNEMVGEILNTVKEDDHAAREQLAALSDQMADIGAPLEKEINFANSLLHTIQFTLYKDHKYNYEDENGKSFVHFPHDRRYADFDAVNWSKVGKAHSAYKKGVK